MHGGRRRLAGRHELVEVIGRGGMGTVYRATDLVLRRTVAVKVLPSALAEQDPSHVARFERGARAAASLADPGVVAIYDTGTDEATRFIVMECVTGRGLSEILRDEAPLEPARAVNVAVRVADACRIDQEAARQITNGLGDVASSHGSGHAVDALHKLASLPQRTAMLAGQGHIEVGAASRLNTALARLSSALLRSPAGTPPARGDQPPGQTSEGQEGAPPGKAKKHGDLRKAPKGG